MTAQCVGCGFECRRGPCGFSNYKMQEDGLTWDKKVGCPYLRQVGIQWRCGMYIDAGPELKKAMEEVMGIGAGCSASLFNTEREAMIRRLQSLSRSSSASPATSSESSADKTR
jgi:hypothetical protein